MKAEQEKKPLRLVEQLGYLMYVRLFIESQKRASLQESFPFAGFPMEWTPGTKKWRMVSGSGSCSIRCSIALDGGAGTFYGNCEAGRERSVDERIM